MGSFTRLGMLRHALAAFFRDLGHACRAARRQPALSVLLLVTLAAGFGIVVTTFSVMDEVLLRALPYPQPAGIHLIASRHPQLGRNILTRQAVYAAFAADSETLQVVAAASRLDLTLNLPEGSRQMDAIDVSPSFFPLFGARASLGKLPTQQELRAGGEGIVLSPALWRSAFGADPSVLGTSLSIHAELRHGQGEVRQTLPVLGVLSDDFVPPFSRLQPELWVVRDLTSYTYESERFLMVLGRLRSGVGRDEAVDELRRIEAGVLARTSETTDWALEAEPLRSFLVGSLREPVALLFVAGCLVFVIAAFNAAGIAAARLQARAAAAAVRMSLGASRRRMFQSFLAEGALLAVTAGVLGLGLAHVALSLFRPLAVSELPRVASLGLSPRAAVFGLSVVVVTSLLLALFPTLMLLRHPLASRLASLGVGGNTGAPAQTRFVFVAAQLASAVTVTVGAVLLQLSSVEIATVDPGFEADQAVAAWVRVDDGSARSHDDDGRVFQRLLDAFANHSAFQAAGLTSDLPLSRGSSAVELSVETPSQAHPWRTTQMRFVQVSPGYFEAMGMPPRSGRLFRADERAPRSFIVSESAARELFGNEDALGRRLKLGGLDSANPWLPVVGVVKDVHADSMRRPAEPTVYLPLLSAHQMALVVRLADAGGSRAMGLVPSLVHQVAPSLPLTDVEPLEHLVERDVASLRLTSWLLTCLALAALGLAATGAYATIWSLTLSHLREMRIRFALGARAGHLVRQSLAVLGPWLVAGVAGGALGAYLLSGLLRNQLFAVGFADPRLIAVLALLLGLLGAGGLLIPLSYHRRLDATSLLRG